MKKFLLLAALCLLLAGCAGPKEADGAVSAALLYGDLLPGGGAPLSDGEMSEAISRVAAAGYPVTDAENRLAFENADAVYGFYDELERGEDCALSLIELCYDGGLIRTDLVCAGGEGAVRTTRVALRGGAPETTYRTEYELLSLEISEKGFLIFTSAVPNATQSVHGGYIEPTVMLRLEMPDAQCAEYARAVDPAGYLSGGLFSTDWGPDDVSALNAATVFLHLCKLHSGSYFSYFDSPFELTEGGYEVPDAAMDGLLERYLPGARGLFEAGLERGGRNGGYIVDAAEAAVPTSDSFLPYADVTGYARNADGTVTLYIDAVFEKYATDCAFRHVLTVTPYADGGFGYISNRIIDSESNIFPEGFYGLAGA